MFLYSLLLHSPSPRVSRQHRSCVFTTYTTRTPWNPASTTTTPRTTTASSHSSSLSSYPPSSFSSRSSLPPPPPPNAATTTAPKPRRNGHISWSRSSGWVPHRRARCRESPTWSRGRRATGRVWRGRWRLCTIRGTTTRCIWTSRPRQGRGWSSRISWPTSLSLWNSEMWGRWLRPTWLPTEDPLWSLILFTPRPFCWIKLGIGIGSLIWALPITLW